MQNSKRANNATTNMMCMPPSMDQKLKAFELEKRNKSGSWAAPGRGLMVICRGENRKGDPLSQVTHRHAISHPDQDHTGTHTRAV